MWMGFFINPIREKKMNTARMAELDRNPELMTRGEFIVSIMVGVMFLSIIPLALGIALAM